MDEKTQAIVADVYNGNLAYKIKNNIKYAITGVFVGLAAGVIIASFAGKSKLIFGLLGAGAGGGLGYLIAPSKK